MPKNFMRYKAGKVCFLLVCLFLCTGCGKQKAVFESGVENISEAAEAAQKDQISVEVFEEEETVQEEKISDELLVNINTAEAEELMTLPGIGEVRAYAIIEYRQSSGKFEKIEDIMNVKGIKTGVFSKINGLICVK